MLISKLKYMQTNVLTVARWVGGMTTRVHTPQLIISYLSAVRSPILNCSHEDLLVGLASCCLRNRVHTAFLLRVVKDDVHRNTWGQRLKESNMVFMKSRIEICHKVASSKHVLSGKFKGVSLPRRQQPLVSNS